MPFLISQLNLERHQKRRSIKSEKGMVIKELNLSRHQDVLPPPDVRKVGDVLPEPGEINSFFDRRAESE